MKDRGMEPDENVQMATLKSNFYYFVLLFAMIMIIVLSFISKPTPFLIGLVLTGFIIVVIIIQVLFSYIISVFEEVREFAGKLPHEERVEYFTSSSYKELLELSKDLNESAAKVYEAREMERKAVIDLENLNKSKTQFILTTEHHLRTPLTIVKGYIKAALTGSFGKIDNKLATALTKADEAANRLTVLVDEFLSISQMEVGKSIFKVKAVNIKNLAADIVKELTEEINKKHLEVILTFLSKEEDNVLNLDPEKIKEVFTSVIDNAIRYNKDGGKIIIVGDKITDGEKQFFRVSVEDTGIGMSSDDLVKLFTGYFQRGEEAQKVYATGKGLSLTAIKSIMNVYQGRIYASSDGKGKGSKFTVEIPIE
jgi:signal transduction histidine kinase